MCWVIEIINDKYEVGYYYWQRNVYSGVLLPEWRGIFILDTAKEAINLCSKLNGGN